MSEPGRTGLRRRAAAGPSAGRLAILAVFVLALAPGRTALAHLGVDEQIADLSARLEREPGNAALLLRRGELHRVHGDWAAAGDDFRRALALDPTLRAVHLALGRLHLEAGEPAAALASLDAFLLAQPAHPEALRLRGETLARLGRPLRAADSFRGAIAAALVAGKGDPSLYLERSAALQAAGAEHLQEAFLGLEEGIARLGAPPTLVLAAADLEEKMGRSDAAAARLDEAARRSRRPERWRARQGEILERSGRAAAALRAYEAALTSLVTLPESRRRTPALAELEGAVRAALERLAPRQEEGAGGESVP